MTTESGPQATGSEGVYQPWTASKDAVASAQVLANQVNQSLELKQSRTVERVVEEDQVFWSENLKEAGMIRAREHRVWLWDGMIPSGEVTLVTGPGGAGKTSLLMRLAGAIYMKAGNLDGVLLAEGAEPIVIVTVGEQSGSQLQQLALLAGAGKETEEGFIPYYHQVMDPALGADRFWDAMRRAREKWPNSMFVTDSAQSCLRVKSDSADSVREAYGLIREVGGTWAVLHHNNKDKDVKDGSVDKVRGSTAWVDGCDRLIMVAPQLGAARLAATRRGDPKEVTVRLPWQKADPTKDGGGQGRAPKARTECHDWMDEHKELLQNGTLAAAYRRYKGDGGTATDPSFRSAYKTWSPMVAANTKR